MNESDYYIFANNQQTGPFSLDELRAKAANGEVSIETLFSKPGMTEWLPLSEVLGAPTVPKPPSVSQSSAEIAPSPMSLTADTKSQESVTGTPWAIVGLAVAVPLVLIVIFILFSDHRTTEEPLLEHHQDREYKWTALKTFHLGTNTDEAKSDVIDFDLARFEGKNGEDSSYHCTVWIRGRKPVVIDKNGWPVRLEANGQPFYAKNWRDSTAHTNALGEAWELVSLIWEPSAVYALTNASNVVLHFRGTARELDVPLTAENIAKVRYFAEWAASADAREFKPVKNQR